MYCSIYRSRIRIIFVAFCATLLITGATSGQNFTQITNGDIVSTRMNSVSASWVDADNDGDLDLFVSNASIRTGNYLYRNLLKETGKANFNRWIAGDLATPGPGSFGHSWADYDNDGDLDCYVAGRAASRLYRNESNGNFTQITTGDIGTRDNRGFSCAWGDYNNDGYVDLVIALPVGFNGLPLKGNHLFLNNGNGSFTKIDSGATPVTSGQAPYTVPSWSDYDLDGDLDLFIGSGPITTTGPDFLYRNLFVEGGADPFERITSGIIATTPRDGQVFNWIDYDNDRDLDVYITNYSGGTANGLPNELYRNDGGSYTRITSGDLVTDESFSLASVWQDFDNDGDLDVYVTTEAGQNNYFYANNGDGTFTKVISSVVTNTNLAATYGATAGDYDNDGDMDIFVPTLLQEKNSVFRKNLLFRNDLTNGNGWINITCVGTLSNKAAIGTKVHARAIINGNSVWQMREISTQNSFNGHNSLRVHFGLGNATKIDELVFQWPSGTVDVITDVDVNQFITVTESGSFAKGSGNSHSEISAHKANFVLHENYPNPFNPTTTIRYALPAESRVVLAIFNSAGQQVRTLVNTLQSAGEKTVQWDGTNSQGKRVSSGIYLYKLEAGNFIRTRKMILMK